MTPDQLKASILQLAIQGKLVPQRPEEGTAEELYQEIQREKKKLVATGKIKKQKPLPMIEESEVPFDIPETWKWVQVHDIALVARGGSPRPIKEFITSSADGVSWIKIGDSIKGSKYIDATREKIIKEGVSRSRFVSEGDLLLSNSMSYGRPYILRIRGCIHDGWLVIKPYLQSISREYLFYVFSSQCAFSQFSRAAAGAVVKNLNEVKVSTCLIPLPPLAEQKRIVAKIEQTLPLIERYGEAYTALETLDKRFPEDMRKSILQYAIQGKLVPQRPEEGSAEDLYKQIQQEKKRLIAAGKIKKEKPLPPIKEDEIPFDIPETWKWVRLGEVFTLQAGKFISASEIVEDFSDELYPCYGGNGMRGYVNKYNKEGDYPLIGRQGALCGNIHRAMGKFYATEHAVVVDVYAKMNVECACVFLKALNLNQYATATAQPGLAVSKIIEVLVPLPPLEEQQRICNFINNLILLNEI